MWTYSNCMYTSWHKIKGTAKSRFSDIGDAVTQPPMSNGPNDLKFCIWGSFMRYIWFLFKLRSDSHYRGNSHLKARTDLASLKIMWPWLKQKSNALPKRSSHVKFQVIWSIGGWVTATPLSKNLDFALPLCYFAGNLIDYFWRYSICWK